MAIVAKQIVDRVTIFPGVIRGVMLRRDGGCAVVE